MSEVTSDLLKWCTSDTQTDVINAIIDKGGSMRAAARSLGKHHSVVQRIAGRIQTRAAREGYAPGHFEAGVAPGYRMGKVTVHRKDGVIQQTWERQHPDDELRDAAIKAGFEAMASELPKLDSVARPNLLASASNYCNLFTITDYHMGMLSWHKEGGADWDLKIAEEMLYRAFEAMIELSPAADTAIINQLGDFLHFDGLAAVTPMHGNLLDADGRFPKIVAAVIRVLRRLIDRALQTHNNVHVVLAEGNHDMVSSIWLRAMFSALYANEPRVTVDESPLPYYKFVWGKNLLGFHHGHLSKNGSLPSLFAAQFRKEWGASEFCYIHTGHKHHKDVKQFPGCEVHQHSTLAARDAYAARGGWFNDRQADAICYHKDFGQISSNTITPKMIEAMFSNAG